MKTELNKNEKLSIEQETPPIANVLLCVVTGDRISIDKGESPCKTCKPSHEYLQCLDCNHYDKYQSVDVWD